MKKMIYFGTGLIILSLFVGCKSDKKGSPGEAAKSYTETLQNRNYDTFVDAIVFDDDVTPSNSNVQRTTFRKTTPQEKANYTMMVKQRHEPMMEKKGGVKKVEVVSENLSNNGNNANVVVKTTYNNGDIEHTDYAMVKDNETWKIKANKDKEVWKKRMADGTSEVLKFKEEPHREVLKDKEEPHREVLKVKDDGEKEVYKHIVRENEEVIKTKVDGEKTVTRVKYDK